jgi:hypothetical protein
MTHGVVLSVAAILCLHRFAKHLTVAHAAGAGLATGAVFLTKAEIFLACAPAVITSISLTFRAHRVQHWRVARLSVLFISMTVLPIAVAFVLLSLAMPPEDALYATLGSWRYIFDRAVFNLLFYQAAAGLDDAGQNIMAMVGVAGFYGLVLLPSMLVAIRIHDSPGPVRLGVALLLFILVAGVLGLNEKHIPWMAAARPLPLFMLALGTGLAVRFVHHRHAPQGVPRRILRITMVVFALALLAKMALNVRVSHYGFVLAMPAMLLLVVALIDWVPWGLTELRGYGPMFRSAALAGLLVMVGAHLRIIHQNLSSKVTFVANGPDRFQADRLGLAVNWAFEQVNRHVGADQTLVVFPGQVMINYLARRENSTPFINFWPPEVILFGEQRIVSSLRERPPDSLLLVHKDTSEYGLRFFGRDYGQQIFAWIESNYRPVSSTGAPPFRNARFGMLLMRRSDGQEPCGTTQGNVPTSFSPVQSTLGRVNPGRA